MNWITRNLTAAQDVLSIWWRWLTIGRKVRREYRRCQLSGKKFLVDDYLSGD